MSSRTIGNVHGRRIARGAELLLPALVAALLVAGVVARPLQESVSVRERTFEALDSVELRRSRWARIRAARESGASERIGEEIARLSAMVPRDLEAIDVHAAVRVAADASSLDVQTLTVGSPRDPGFPVLEDRVLLRDVGIVARGTLAALERLVAALRGLGLPTAVLDLSLRREDESQPEYEIELTLGVFHAVDAAALPARGGEDR